MFSAAGGGGPAIPLRQGPTVSVTFTDGVGNVETLTQELLNVDFKPAELTMSLTDAGGTDLTATCGSDATNAACVADLKDLGGGAYQNANKQCAFDRVAGNGCPADLLSGSWEPRLAMMWGRISSLPCEVARTVMKLSKVQVRRKL